MPFLHTLSALVVPLQLQDPFVVCLKAVGIGFVGYVCLGFGLTYLSSRSGRKQEGED